MPAEVLIPAPTCIILPSVGRSCRESSNTDHDYHAAHALLLDVLGQRFHRPRLQHGRWGLRIDHGRRFVSHDATWPTRFGEPGLLVSRSATATDGGGRKKKRKGKRERKDGRSNVGSRSKKKNGQKASKSRTGNRICTDEAKEVVEREKLIRSFENHPDARLRCCLGHLSYYNVILHGDSIWSIFRSRLSYYC